MLLIRKIVGLLKLFCSDTVIYVRDKEAKREVEELVRRFFPKHKVVVKMIKE